ncbi:hypothetical protein ULMA_31530 [Patiriisocius marinus]|uniref:Uncharacterized protein n=1 Tax=Patiriisocius marinus TaxID=1397112 RepID=A0A5J4ISR0_9FLAO|nr:hypothetical protein [Patiriisocius marinus]GER61045.1 hypothetical protein ULMA_31530 [Patiriisocius marinus]
MRKILKYIGLIIFIFSFTCCESETEFKKIEFDRSIDVIENIGRNLNPDEKYEYWALLRANDGGHEHVDVINEFGNLNKRKLIDLTYSQDGFLKRGHHSTSTYYILAVKDNKVFKIEDTQNLLLFLDGIDTMEEALLITQMNEFGIDDCFIEGGAYRKTNNRYEFQLMRSNHGNTSIIDLGSYALIQHLVFVEKNGKLSSKSGGIYCKGKKECIDCE